MKVVDEINQLRKEKNAVILAHYYVDGAIQDIADFVGDSLALAQKAATTDADMIVLCGVHFMAETAKIINPSKTVVLPDEKAGCSLAESAPPAEFEAFVNQYPDHKVVTYVNCSAEIKALSDIVCTSSNAEKIIASFPEDQKLIFAPDKNLGAYLNKTTGRDMLLWDGACMVHEAFSIQKLTDLKLKHPNAVIAAHPESEEHILLTADFVGSTSQILKFVKETNHPSYIIATEAGILHQMIQENPDKELIAAPVNEDNTCACSECIYMKMNTLDKVRNCMRDESPIINLSDELMQQALSPIERMLEISK